jgi:hypothetical protein
MYIKDTKAEATNQMASYLSFKESRKEHTPQPSRHITFRRGLSLIFLSK